MERLAKCDIYYNKSLKNQRITMQDHHFDESLEHLPIAMAYVPWQHLSCIYENLEEAFQKGTIFPELDKPFTGRRVVS